MGGSTRSTASKGASQGTAGRMSCCFPAVCREPLPKVGLLSPPRPAEHLLLLHLLSHPLQAPQCHRWVEGPFFPRAAAFSQLVLGGGHWEDASTPKPILLPRRPPARLKGPPSVSAVMSPWPNSPVPAEAEGQSFGLCRTPRH